MGTMTTLLTLLLSLTSLLTATAALPLSTSSRWIVDENGQRVKLACVNWVAHLDPVVAEGLSKQPLDSISKRITSLGFNCVRLTWPLYLATNDSLAAVTVRQSFQSLGLQESIAGMQSNNPSLIDLPLLKAFQVNHRSKWKQARTIFYIFISYYFFFLLNCIYHILQWPTHVRT